MCRSIIYSSILIMLVSASCSTTFEAVSTPTAVPSSTPEKIELINGEMDACLLIHSTEVETVLGIKVTSANTFLDSVPSCKYISIADDRVVLLTRVTTDATIKRANQPWLKNEDQFYSAVEVYEMRKMAELRLHKALSESYKVEDIDSIGDQAFFTDKQIYLALEVLENEIFYEFVAYPIDNGGIDYDAFIELAKIALQRMP